MNFFPKCIVKSSCHLFDIVETLSEGNRIKIHIFTVFTVFNWKKLLSNYGL